jgi:4'-phosphopantetheinyl transferase
MSLYQLENNDTYRLGIWKIEEDEISLRRLIKEDIAVPFTNAGKRIEFLAVRALVKAMDIDPLKIAHFHSGKPYIENCALNISISHTKGYAAILLSSQIQMGIDIEQMSKRILKVRSKFMHPDEEKALFGQDCNELSLLLLHWCAKESLYKAIPDEEVDFINDLRILQFNISGEKGSFRANALKSGINFQVYYTIEKDFVLTCCFSEESR